MTRSSAFSITARLAVLVLIAWTILPVSQAFAAQLTGRSLTLGSSADSIRTTHTFNFTTGETANIGSMSFDYCTTPSGGCTTPTGFNTEEGSLAIGTQSGATGFSVHANTDTNTIVITRSATSLPASTAVTMPFGTGNGSSNGPTNSSTANETFYVRITTYTSTDGTTGATDTGVVAASTAQQILLTGTMDESLVFCTGITITGQNCGTVSGNTVNFGNFSTITPSSGTSVMAASTNGAGGYVITVNGTTLTCGGCSGSPTVSALATPTASSAGTAQFGLNLKDNATPNIGAEVNPSPNGSSLRGQASTDYNTADLYKFVTGNQVAASDNGGVGSTNAQTFTVSYIVNVPGNQPAGAYTATMTYIATPTF